MVGIVIARYVHFNSTQHETYLNNTLALMVLSNLMREGAFEQYLAHHGLLTVTAAQQLSLAVMVFAAAEFMGFITLWARLSPEQTRRRHRFHRAAATVLAVAALIAAAPAREAGQTLEEFGGWRVVLAWSLFVAMYMALAAQLLRMTAREVFRSGARRGERLLAISGFGLGVAVGATSIDAVVLAVLEQLGWVHSVEFRLSLHGSNIFWETVAACAFGAVPLVLTLCGRAGLDATSRHWRRLQPLRVALTTAVPSSVFELRMPNTRRQKTELDLHQTTVQLLDANLRLRVYFPGIDHAAERGFLQRFSVPEKHHDSAVLAFRLACAIHAKARGVTPAPFDMQVVHESRSDSLEAETDKFLRVAQWWSKAQQAASNDTSITLREMSQHS